MIDQDLNSNNNNNNDGEEITTEQQKQQFQSKFVESSYLDCSSTSSMEDLEESEELMIADRSEANKNNGDCNNSNSITIQIQETDIPQTFSSSSSNENNNGKTSSLSSKTKLVRNPITLVEEYHSSSSLSSYSSCSVSNENIFAAIKDVEDTMNLFTTTSSTSGNGETTAIIIDQERPGRKLSISASSIPLPIPSQSSTVSPLTLSCSAPSLPGVSQSIQVVSGGGGGGGLVSSQEKEITLIHSQPDIRKSKHTSRSKSIFKFKKSSSKENNNNGSGNNGSGSSNEAISPSVSTSSNLSTSSSSSSSSGSGEKKDKKRKWRLRLKKSLSFDKGLNKEEKEMETIEEEKKEENKEIEKEKEKEIVKEKEPEIHHSGLHNLLHRHHHDEEQSNNNSNNNEITTSTTTTTTTSTTPTKPTTLEEGFNHIPPFVSTSLPPLNGSLSEISDFDSNNNNMDDEDMMPRGGRGRSNAFYMKGAPVISNQAGEFKISLPKPPSLPNLVQLSIPSILPKDSFSLLSKPSVFSKFKSKYNSNNQSQIFNNNNNNNNNNNSNNTTTSTTTTTTTPSTTTTSDNKDNSKETQQQHYINMANKIIKNNSSRFIVGFADTIGRRPNMEDESVIHGCFRGRQDEDYFALFDGHGGKDASIQSSIELHRILAEKLKSHTNNPVKSLKESFQCMNSLLLEKGIKGGTTAVVALFLGKKGYIANVGDSRAVLCRDGTAVRVSLDHKPNLPKEEERIRQLGGTVTSITNSSGVVTSRVNGQLAVSRALGDHFLQPYVSCEPEIHGPINIDAHSKNQFMILACDGLWDVMTDEEAVTMVLPLINDPESACIKLRQEAFNLGSTDNISIIVIKFPIFQEQQ